MNEDLIVKLDEEIGDEIEQLKSLKYGSEEQSKVVENLTKLYKMRIEDSKAGIDYNKEIDDDLFRKKQLKEQRIDRYVKIGIAAAELMIPIMFYSIWMRRGFEFEKDGSFTSTTFKGLINRFRPTKK